MARVLLRGPLPHAQMTILMRKLLCQSSDPCHMDSCMTDTSRMNSWLPQHPHTCACKDALVCKALRHRAAMCFCRPVI